MIPMTPDDRALIAQALGSGNPAAPELVYATAQRLGYTGSLADALGPGMRYEIAAVIRRLLDAEADLAAARRVLADLAVLADDSPDAPLTAADITTRATTAGLNLMADIETAEALRAAEQTAGVW